MSNKNIDDCFDDCRCPLHSTRSHQRNGDRSQSDSNQTGTHQGQYHQNPRILDNKNAEQKFDCAICHEMMMNPVTTECGHNFCQYCLRQHYTRSTRYNNGTAIKCPICRICIRCEYLPGVNLVLRTQIETIFPNILKKRLEMENTKNTMSILRQRLSDIGRSTRDALLSRSNLRSNNLEFGGRQIQEQLDSSPPQRPRQVLIRGIVRTFGKSCFRDYRMNWYQLCCIVGLLLLSGSLAVLDYGGDGYYNYNIRFDMNNGNTESLFQKLWAEPLESVIVDATRQIQFWKWNSSVFHWGLFVLYMILPRTTNLCLFLSRLIWIHPWWYIILMDGAFRADIADINKFKMLKLIRPLVWNHDYKLAMMLILDVLFSDSDLLSVISLLFIRSHIYTYIMKCVSPSVFLSFMFANRLHTTYLFGPFLKHFSFSLVQFAMIIFT